MRDPERRVGVLFSHGPHFTAGLDLAKLAELMASADVREGLMSFLERREARFEGR